MVDESYVAGIHYSIVIPAYNCEQTLAACLDSLSRQTIPRGQYEIIVVDDGSTDNTAKVAQGHAILYFHQSNAGPAAARNLGVARASGAIILFTDSDCVPNHDWLEQMTAPFVDPGISGVKGAYWTAQKALIARFAQMEFEDRYDLLQTSPCIDLIATYSAAFRRHVFLDVGGFDTRFPRANNEDTEFSYRLTKAGYRLVFNPKARVRHIHPATLRQYLRVKFWRGYWRMIVYRLYPQKALKDAYTPIALKLQTVFMTLSLPYCMLASLDWRWLLPALALWIGIIVSTLPFSCKTYKKDQTIGMLSPIIIFLRSAVFALGSIAGILKSFCFPLAPDKQALRKI